VSLSVVQSRALKGAQTLPVRVEIHLANGLPSFQMVGLPDAEVKESRERVRSALLNSGFEFPSRRITVNLAPADLPKGSGRFDLPIAIGIAAASGQLPKADLDAWEFSGELSLSGEILGSSGAFALALSLRQYNLNHLNQLKPRQLLLGHREAAEAGCVAGLNVYGAPTLLAACAHLVGHGTPLVKTEGRLQIETTAVPDLKSVKGQHAAKRALEIAAAGGHNLLMMGPPGSGKSMLAQRLPGILPAPSEEEALESAALRSLKGLPLQYGRRPFESPHHSASSAAIVGGGKPPQPGSITLAHNGLLFLDEVLEFDRRCLESLREPLETGQVHLARVGHAVTYPARFQWVVAHNPCPCGWLGHPSQQCRCSAQAVARYRMKLSGPLLDRLDIGIEVPPTDQATLLAGAEGESSVSIKARVEAARSRQIQRQQHTNNQLQNEALDEHCELSAANTTWLVSAAQKLNWSGRATHRVLRVARTIADLAESPHIEKPHLAEALQLRKLLHLKPSA